MYQLILKITRKKKKVLIEIQISAALIQFLKRFWLSWIIIIMWHKAFSLQYILYILNALV